MKTKPRFAIGQSVTVKATVEFRYLRDEGKEGVGPWKRQPVRKECEPFMGLVVGARTRMLGTYEHGSSGSYYDDPEPSYLSVKGCVRVWLVARSMTNLPVEVLDGDVEAATTQQWPPQCPWQIQKQPPWDERARKFASDAAKDTPLDAKGRFLKYTGAKA